MSASIRSKSLPSSNKTSPENAFEPSPVTTILDEALVLQIPGCTVNLVEEGQAVEIAKEYFNLVKHSDENVPSVILVKVGDELQWPLAKDEPVVKLDALDYLFSLQMEDMNLSYGVSFSQQSDVSGLTDLDSFLKEHSCFSGVSSPSTSGTTSDARALNWAELAPRIKYYDAVLEKAIPSRSHEIVKGIFKLSNVCTKQVQKGGAMVITETENNKSNKKTTDGTKKSALLKGLERVRTFSDMTEKSSTTVLTIVEMGTESAVGPISSHAEKQILATVPGKVLLDSLGTFGRHIDAAEVAEKQALSAASKAAAKMVSNRFKFPLILQLILAILVLINIFGESAGEATEDIFAIAGHTASTAFNIVKIQGAIDPVSSVSTTMAKNAIMKNL
ncbi:senescence/dehydration-associated protein At4g35985, chloroplastic-like [Papaver somniferum]|uniref:senescence/dehydration-associated protein At4g35985, chloroplastic-like n=1 Tax=Papaver somniferum TaxID=3469 RepID=UPI000E7003B0|nr:senescence/dehydration-associated protein At4g35985, chloroplastic-like [Papaver somniferum]